MTSSHAGTPQARAKIHTTLTDFEIALPIRGSPAASPQLCIHSLWTMWTTASVTRRGRVYPQVRTTRL